MKQRVETGRQSAWSATDDADNEWPAAWPDRIPVRFALAPRPARPVLVEPAPPTSARTVLTALEPGTSRTIPDLLERTRLPARTLRHAVRWLEVQGKVERISYLGDARRNLVRLRHRYGSVRIEPGLAGGVAC